MTVPNPKSKIGVPTKVGHQKSLAPPQFGLRTLLLLVAACAVLLALRQWLPPMAILGLALLGVTIFLHVAGNCIGTRLRALGDRPDSIASDSSPRRLIRPEPHNFAPATHLGQRRSLGWIIVIATFAGIIAGGLGGGFWTTFNSRGSVGISNVAIGVIAFATLGGIASFAVVGFTQVLLSAIWQAMKQPLPQSAPRSSADLQLTNDN
jgi:hypothetical protein